MHLLAIDDETKPVKRQRTTRRVFAQIMAVLTAVFAVLLVSTGPAAAKAGTFEGYWAGNQALKRAATCIVVTNQNTGKTGGKLTECTGSTSADRDGRWDNTGQFRWQTRLKGQFTTSKGSNGCPKMGASPYIKCVFIYSANIVVTISGGWDCCPSLTKRSYDVRWARIR